MNRMRQGYNRSVRIVHQTLLRGTPRRAEVLRILVHGLRSTKALMFSSPSRFRCTYLTFSTAFCTRGKEPLSCRYFRPRVNSRLSEIRRRMYVAEILQEQT